MVDGLYAHRTSKRLYIIIYIIQYSIDAVRFLACLRYYYYLLFQRVLYGCSTNSTRNLVQLLKTNSSSFTVEPGTRTVPGTPEVITLVLR